MFAKVLASVVVVAALGIGGFTLYSATKTGNCCPLAALGLTSEGGEKPCCSSQQACCETKASCCDAESLAISTASDCCSANLACCDSGADCCLKVTAFQSDASIPECCFPGSDCCTSADCCLLTK